MASTVEIKENIDPKKYFQNARHIIEYAFSIGKKHYFRFSDHLNVPYERALSCLVYYREVDLNIDRDFMQEHLKAIDGILTSSKIDVFKIKQLNDQLLTRLQLPKDPELMYKLASVVFFDQEETPEVYEWEYAKKKIAFWKENASLRDFFLQKPLKELIPYLEYCEENLETFSRMVQDVNKVHSEKVSEILSGSSKMNSNAKKDSSPAVIPQN
jgi:hypothetical protein